MRIFDIHTHILPGVDDGAGTMEEALRMLECCVAADVKAVAVTPHCNVRGFPDNYRGEQLREAFLRLRRAALEIPVELHPGAEVRVNDRFLPALKAGKLQTLGKGNFLLTEFSMDEGREAFLPALEGVLETGYVPLIAHPERYRTVVEDPRIVGSWLDMGCHIQLTGGSLGGFFGRRVARTAEYLVKNDMVCCVASDAHDPVHRSNYLSDAYDHLALRCGRRYADILMWENPMRICMGEGV